MKKHRQGTKPEEVLNLVDVYIIIRTDYFCQCLAFDLDFGNHYLNNDFFLAVL